MKRKLSILLAATMVASMLPTGVFAASVNNVTGTPSASTNSEWSLKEGNTTYAPQVTFKASSSIPKGEMVTLTLSGAEWAFYDTGIGLSDGSSFTERGSINNDYPERFASTDPKALGNIMDARKAPYIDRAVSISASGAGSNSQAYYNLAAAATANPNSSDADNGTVPKPDTGIDVPTFEDAEKFEEFMNTNVTGTVYFTDINSSTKKEAIEAFLGGVKIADLIDAVNKAVEEYNTRKAEYDDEKGFYDKSVITYNDAVAKYGDYKTDSYKKAMEDAKVVMDGHKANLDAIYTKVKSAMQVATEKKTVLNTNIEKLMKEIKARKSTYDKAVKTEADAQKAYDNATAAMKPSLLEELNKAKTATTKAKESYETLEVYENDLKAASAKSLGSVKAVSAVNFEDVAFEAANVISFRTTQDLKVNDRISIPLLVKVYDASPTVSITSATGAISSNTYTIAKVSTGATVATISSAVSFSETANLYPIVISETNPGAFMTSTKKRTNDIRITLPAGFSWVATDKTGNERTSGYVTSTNKSINNGTKDGDINQNDTANRKYDLDYKAGKAVIDESDNGILTIHLTNEEYEVSPNSNAISKIMLSGAKIEASKSTAKQGDVKASFKGTNLTSQTLVIAKYGDHKLNLSVDKVPDRIAGRSYLNDEDNVKSGVVRFTENVEDSWWANRRTEFVVNRGDIRAVDIKVLDDVTEAGDGDLSNSGGARTGISHSELVSGVRVVNAKEDLSGEVVSNNTGVKNDNRARYLNGYYDVSKSNGDDDFGKYMYITTLEGSNDDFRRFVMNEFVVESTRNNIVSGERKTMADMELTFYVEVPALSDGVDNTEDKDLTVTLKAPGEDEQTVKITNLKEPITIERVNKDINLGYQKTTLGAVTISENFVGGFVPVEKRGVMYDGDHLDNTGGLEDSLKLRVIGDDAAVKSEMTYNIDSNEAPDTPKAVTDGAVVGDILISDGKIKRESSTLSKVTITPTIDLKRFLPEGKYDFKVDGIDELGSDVVIPEYVNIITAAENKNTKYASDVKIVADGTTSTMTVDGKEVQMNAPAYINEDDYVMLPLRDVAKALGISEENISFRDGWATVGVGNTFVQAKAGDTNLYINGNAVPMGTTAYINPANERMFLPIGFIATAFGIEKQWDGATKTATLNPSRPVGTGASTGETPAK